MSTEQMRKYVLDAYPGESWKVKVRRMSDSQITAVYFNISRKK